MAKPALCAVVPAAGRGSRLGVDIPKVFVSLRPGWTIWDALHEQLARVADRVVLVLSPEGTCYLADHRAEFPAESFSRTELACQGEPTGMGDAIFGAAELWRDARDLLIVWGDQVNLSAKTFRGCVERHDARKGPALTLPVTRVKRPYVEYVFDAGGHLREVRQSREGDKCAANGFSDVGMFLLTGGAALLREWEHYRAAAREGAATGELNFLPFLAYLSVEAGWPVNRYEVSDPAEARGVNTPEDLAWARKLWAEKRR